MQGGKIRIVSNEPTSPRKVIRIGQDPPITINHGEFHFGHVSWKLWRKTKNTPIIPNSLHKRGSSPPF